MFRKMSVLLLLLSLILIATVARADDAEDANIATCKRFYDEVMNQGKVDLIDALVAEGFVDHEEFPGIGTGRTGLKQFVTMMRTAFPDLTFTADFFMADGDKVAAYLSMTGTHQGPFMDMAATGNRFDVHCIDIVRFENGKAVEHWGVSDTGMMMEQLGAMAAEK